jgi:hypothetical protein
MKIATSHLQRLTRYNGSLDFGVCVCMWPKKKGGHMEKHQFALENFKNIQELIRFTDQKAGLILVIFGFMLTLFLNSTKGLSLVYLCSIKSTLGIVWSLSIFIVGLIFIIVSVFQIYFVLFKIIYPRSAHCYKKKEYSLFYFEHIAKLSRDQFRSGVKELPDNDNGILDEILGQVYEVACIQKEKTDNLRIAIVLIYVAVIALLIFCFLSSNPVT